MRHTVFSLIILSFIQLGCATALQLPSRKSNPEYFTQEVKDDYFSMANNFYQDMERATYVIIDGIFKDGARYDTKFFPITKPLIISNANGMVLEKHILPGQKVQMRDNALKAFGYGKRCFQLWRSVTYIGNRTEKADKEFEERYWKFTALNKGRSLSLHQIPKEQIPKMNVNPTKLPIYENVFCANEDLDYFFDVTILSEITLYPDLKRQVTWIAPKP